MPVSLAILLISFVLTPPVIWLQRRIGRLAAVLLVVTLVFSGLGLAAWGIARQMSSLSTDLVTYRANIRAKVQRRARRRPRRVGRAAAVHARGHQEGHGRADGARRARSRSRWSCRRRPSGVPGLSWLGPFVAPAGTAGFVDRARAVHAARARGPPQPPDRADRPRPPGRHHQGLRRGGPAGQPAAAAADAGQRDLRRDQRRRACGCSACRTRCSGALPAPPCATSPTSGRSSRRSGPFSSPWRRCLAGPGPLEVAGFYVLLELFTNLVLETVLYAGAAGVSQVALLVAVAFWTWLWGPLGLLMATPLTVCLVVLGKHVPGLKFVATLLADTPALAPEYGYYQRLLARDVGRGGRGHRSLRQGRARRKGLRRAAGAGPQLRGARPARGSARARRRAGGDRRDAGADDRRSAWRQTLAAATAGAASRARAARRRLRSACSATPRTAAPTCWRSRCWRGC